MTQNDPLICYVYDRGIENDFGEYFSTTIRRVRRIQGWTGSLYDRQRIAGLIPRRATAAGVLLLERIERVGCESVFGEREWECGSESDGAGSG